MIRFRLRDAILMMLGEYITRCPSRKYAILEYFAKVNKTPILQAHQERLSFQGSGDSREKDEAIASSRYLATSAKYHFQSWPTAILFPKEIS